MNVTEIAQIFENKGGKFLLSPLQFLIKQQSCKVFVYDWDGVFNKGEKGIHPNTFSESDCMGINMMRFGYWLKNKEENPPQLIITGSKNQTMVQLAYREHFHSLFFRSLNKIEALDFFLKLNPQYTYDDVCFVFDDIIDFSLAEKVKLRIMVKRNASPMLEKYVVDNQLVDYITSNESGNFALREFSELFLATNGNFDETIKLRTQYYGQYMKYFEQRNTQKPSFYEMNTNNKFDILENIDNETNI